ncbi:MAG: cation:proton antiporter [Nitrososphaerota archaeon]|nr:cation:proton antiporter [Nitrososphaerota archaeon]
MISVGVNLQTQNRQPGGRRVSLTPYMSVPVFAAVLGELFEQFGLPSVAGALLSGLLLGPTFLSVETMNSQINAVSTISLFFIVFLIGFQMRTETLSKNLPRASIVTLTSFVIPFAIAIFLSLHLFQLGPVAELFLP